MLFRRIPRYVHVQMCTFRRIPRYVHVQMCTFMKLQNTVAHVGRFMSAVPAGMAGRQVNCFAEMAPRYLHFKARSLLFTGGDNISSKL